MTNNVRISRIRKKLTQKELAKIAGVGQVTVSNIETERYVPRVDIALKVAAALEMSVEELFVLEK